MTDLPDWLRDGPDDEPLEMNFKVEIDWHGVQNCEYWFIIWNGEPEDDTETYNEAQCRAWLSKLIPPDEVDRVIAVAIASCDWWWLK